MTMTLRPIHERDHALLREIYADAVETQAPGSYSPAQVRAWASLAWLPGVLDRTFAEGSGWISGNGDAFAIRHPSNRLALLYCRGRASGRGMPRPFWIGWKLRPHPSQSILYHRGQSAQSTVA